MKNRMGLIYGNTLAELLSKAKAFQINMLSPKDSHPRRLRELIWLVR